MTEYFIPNGSPRFVHDGHGFSVGEGVSRIQYPGNWIALSTPEDLAARGICPAPTYDSATHVLERDNTTGWVVRAKTAEELTGETERERAAALTSLDYDAGRSRARYISTGTGMELVYAEKQRQARDLLNGGVGPWPILEAEAPARGLTATQLAQVVVDTAAQWAVIAGQIEAERARVKALIQAATSPAGVKAALSSATWP